MSVRIPFVTALAAALVLATTTTISTGGAAALGAQTPTGAVTAGSGSAPSGDVVVDRDKSGRVVQIRSQSGTSFRAAADDATPRSAALVHVGRYAPAFGVEASDMSVARVVRGATGGSVVHLRQQVDGLPVLGGEMVMSLGAGGGLLSVEGHVAKPEQVNMAGIASARAVRVAVASVAKRTERKPADLSANLEGDWLFEPDLLGVRGGLEPRRVWRVEVTDGAAVREMVLIDAATGRVLLHVDEVEAALNRQVCDDQNRQQSVTDCAYVPSPARTETGPASGVADVNSAFELTGATAQMYAEIAGLDLTQLIGSGGGSYPKKLSSWVRYCTTVSVDPTCPMENAFWSGNQMYFGEGYAGADDVVGHEMTHGVIERFSDLFYFHQSGAINESLADVMGEILDHRHASAGDGTDDWRLGEDVPGGAIRDLADPTLFGQPDRMTSPLYDADPQLHDNGGVHTNSGVGNKTAYLISQGGTFNGVTVSGIDRGDPTLGKTATLYVEVIRRLSSGAGYAELGRTLEQACTELAAATAGLTDDDCSSVSAAVLATELDKSPTVPGAAPPPDVAASCPAGTKVPLFSNEGSLSGLTRSDSTMWTAAPNTSWGIPSNARTGTSSLFGFDPDPGNYGDPSVSFVTMTTSVALPAGQPAYLHFDQWRMFEWTDGATPTYNDGGTVTVFAAPDPSGTFTARSVPADAWVNGPKDPIPSSPVPGFGGDSHGWTSSRLDLSSLGGQSVKVRWTVRGDASGSYIGWFLDNLSVYACHMPVPPGPVTELGSAPLSGPRVRLTWNAPTEVGDGLSGFSVTRSDGDRQKLAADANSLTTGTLLRGTSYTFRVRTLGGGGVTRGATSVTVRAPSISLAAPPARVRKGTRLAFKGTVFAVGTRTPAKGTFVTLQWRRPGTTKWHSQLPDGSALSSRVGSDGAYRIPTVAKSSLLYRVILPSYATWFPGTSKSVKVGVTG